MSMNENVSLKSMINVAEKLRCDKKLHESVEMFESILQNYSDGLSYTCVRYVWAHYGAALAELFVPYANRQGYLDKAEEMLRKALNVAIRADGDDPILTLSVGGGVQYRWAWAHLGDVFRNKGNEPAFSFQCSNDRFSLRMADGKAAYWLSNACFQQASPPQPLQGTDSPLRPLGERYPWAKAHYGAMLANRRRFDVQPAGLKFQGLVDSKQFLSQALSVTNNSYPWALIHLGIAHFVSALFDVAQHVEKHTKLVLARDSNCSEALDHFQVLNSSLDAATEFMYGVYSTLIALVQDPPDLYRHPVQPGAVALDASLALTYDLLDFAAICAKTLTPGSADSENRAHFTSSRHSFLDRIQGLLDLHVSCVDLALPESAAVRRAYVEAYVYYLRDPHPESKPCTTLETKCKAVVDRARNVLTHNPILKCRDRLPSYTSNEFLIRVFDVMMILIKVGAICKISKIDIKDIAPTNQFPLLVHGFDTKLDHVLRNSVDYAVETIAAEAQDHPRALHPVMCEADYYRHMLKINKR
ncbi:hypothetical protein WME94_00730 [Sorangium sp. So ce429]